MEYTCLTLGGSCLCRALNCFSPNINLIRDPRWGRASETYGEDPHLTAEYVKAYVTGLQGNDSRYLKACGFFSLTTIMQITIQSVS